MKNLGVIIPSPICNFHSALLEIENTTGKLLMNRNLRPMLVTHREGYEIPVSLGVRINADIYNKIEYVGSLNFEMNSIQSCILVVSKKGRIMSMTRPAKEFFDVEAKMSQYNSDFPLIFKVRRTSLTLSNTTE